MRSYSNAFRKRTSFSFQLKDTYDTKNENETIDSKAFNERIQELEGRIEFLENTIREILRP